MLELFIYLIGVTITLITSVYAILKTNNRITFGDLIGIIFTSVLSWIGFFIILFTFNEVVIYKKK